MRQLVEQVSNEIYRQKIKRKAKKKEKKILEKLKERGKMQLQKGEKLVKLNELEEIRFKIVKMRKALEKDNRNRNNKM